MMRLRRRSSTLWYHSFPKYPRSSHDRIVWHSLTWYLGRSFRIRHWPVGKESLTQQNASDDQTTAPHTAILRGLASVAGKVDTAAVELALRQPLVKTLLCDIPRVLLCCA